MSESTSVSAKARTGLLLSLLLLCWLPLWPQAGTPLAPEHPDTLYLHSEILIDPWAWLRQREHPQLPGVLAAEERYAESQLKSSRRLARKLVKEMNWGSPKEHTSEPREENGYLYYTKTRSNQSYPVHYRRLDSPNAREQVILDENKLARGHRFFSLDVFKVSPDNRFLAYSADFTGDEDYALFIKDLEAGATWETRIINLDDALWLPDSRSLLLTTVNSRFQTDSAWLYDSTTGQFTSLYEESDPTFDLGIDYSEDRQFIFLSSSSSDTVQNWFLRADDPACTLRPFNPRVRYTEIYPEHMAGSFYLLSNHEYQDFALYRAADDSIAMSAWSILVPGRTGEPIENYLLLKDTVAVLKRKGGFQCLDLIDLASGQLRRAIQPESPSQLGLLDLAPCGSDSLFYYLENEATPYTEIRHLVSSGKEMVIYPDLWEMASGYPEYRIELHWVVAPDSVRIPLRLICRKDLDTSLPQPLWLYGYGAYGSCEDPYFDFSLLSLLDRGFIYAVAHVRGGGELGLAWQQGGRHLNKLNSCSDFLACIDYLTANGYTTSEQLVIEGGSAGGLLIGTVINLAPGKMRVAIADVPFVDLLNTMLDPDLPLTQQEYAEWGDPNRVEEFHYLRSYSPYDNVRPAEYPAILVHAAWEDIRVGFWEGLKWVQKLRRCNRGSNPIIYLLERDQGHLGSGDSIQSFKTRARIMAWAVSLLDQ